MAKKQPEKEIIVPFVEELENPLLLQLEYIIKTNILSLMRTDVDSLYDDGLVCLEFINSYTTSKFMITELNEEKAKVIWKTIRGNVNSDIIVQFLLNTTIKFIHTLKDPQVEIIRLASLIDLLLNRGTIKNDKEMVSPLTLDKDGLVKLFESNLWLFVLYLCTLLGPISL